MRQLCQIYFFAKLQEKEDSGFRGRYKNENENEKKSKSMKQSKRVLAMHKDPACVWGKNKPLETFWQHLTTNVVVFYKNGSHAYIPLPSRKTQKFKKLFDNFDDDDNVVAILCSPLSQDAYELGLYPKAKDHTVDFVINNYKNYFKPLTLPTKIDENAPLMQKVHTPFYDVITSV